MDDEDVEDVGDEVESDYATLWTRDDSHWQEL